MRHELDRIAAGAAATAGQRAGAPEGLWTICQHDADFPARLTQFENAADVPHVLHGLGRRSLISDLGQRPAVAVVGARRAMAYGREVAYQLARDAAAAGITVVSGMALGIDGAAHRGALQGGGRTIAVLAGGVERPYPRSHRLLHEQILDSGTVVSESPCGVEARRWSFVSRNRIIAGLADITVFVEGSENSGARHTVGFAEELDTLVGVVPGPVTSPMSAGPNALLGEVGILPIRSIDDVTAALGVCGPCQEQLGQHAASGEHEEELLAQLAAGARDARSLAEALPQIEPREIMRLLGALELRGVLQRTASGQYEQLAQRGRD